MVGFGVYVISMMKSRVKWLLLILYAWLLVKIVNEFMNCLSLSLGDVNGWKLLNLHVAAALYSIGGWFDSLCFV